MKYKKGENVRFISHLDFVRAFNRALRRSGLKAAHSGGFNPHPILSVALPLPVGLTSECELLTFKLENEPEPMEVAKMLSAALPDGVSLTSLSLADGKRLFSKIAKAAYIVHPERMPTEDEIKEFLAMPSIIMDKKTKAGVRAVDIREDIFSIFPRDDYLDMTLSAGSERNLNPRLCLDAMEKYITGLEMGLCKIHRKALFDNCNHAL